MATKAVERLISINRSLVETLHRRGLISVGGAQMLLQDLAEAAKNIENTALASANRAVADVKQTAGRAVADVKKAVVKERKQLSAKVKATVKKVTKPAAKKAPKKATKKPAAKKAVAKKVVAKKTAAKKPAKKTARR